MKAPWICLAVALAACTRSPEPPAAAPPSGPAPTSAAAPSAPPSAAPATAPQALDPLPPGTPAQEEALAAGHAALTRGAAAEALTHFLAATEGPASGAQVSARMAAADLLVQQGRAGEARAHYLALLASAGHLAEVQFTAGRFFAGQDEVPPAVAAFQAAIRAQPDFLPAYTLLGALWAQQGLNEDAARLLLEYERRLTLRLRQVAEPRSPEVERLATIDLLAVLVDERAEATLRRLLADPSPAIRIAVAGAVADQDEPEALVALANAVTAERDYTALQVLKEALRRARDRATQGGTSP